MQAKDKTINSNKNELLDPVTIADLICQKTIEECMGFHFPNLKLVGEES